MNHFTCLPPKRWLIRSLLSVFVGLANTSMDMALAAGKSPLPSDYAASVAWQTEHAQITRLLNVDRFMYYRKAWLNQWEGKRPSQVTQAIRSIKIEDALRLTEVSPHLLADPMNYDALLTTLAREKSMGQIINPVDVEWNYNFFKRKLKEAFVLQSESGTSLPGLIESVKARTLVSDLQTVPPRPKTRVLLDVDHYISDRTTRAVFWDSAVNNRPIEFHMGTERAFRTRLQASGGEVLAEVKAVARNYNKIYLIKYPHVEKPVYAFTRISGADRLDHLIRQISLIQMGEQTLKPQASVRVYGEPDRIKNQVETSLTQFLERMPRADLVIMGQKGAIEGLLKNAYFLQGLIALGDGHSNSVKQRLSAADFARFERLVASAKASGNMLSNTRNLEEAGRLAKLLQTELGSHVGVKAGQEKLFTIENVSHDLSDVVLRTANGETKRWRLISNVWGDEVRPIARALARTGHQNVVSIGTAGALEGKGLKVGDLAVAKAFYTEGSAPVPMGEVGAMGFDPKAKPVTVGHVSTPYLETVEWYQSVEKHIDAIELETAYLERELKGKAKYQSFFLISDIVGSEAESLASASSSARKNSLLRLFQEIVSKQSVTSLVPSNEVEGRNATQSTRIRNRIEELSGKRSIESKFQLAQVALHENRSSDAELMELINRERAFTRELLNGRLTTMGHALSFVADSWESTGQRVRLYLPPDFMDGRWNPSSRLEVLMQVESEAARAKIQAEIDRVMKDFAKLSSMLDVTVTHREPQTRFLEGIVANAGSSHFLADIYADIALRHGGLHATINTAGQHRYTRIHGLRTASESLPSPEVTGSRTANSCSALFGLAR